MSRHELLTLVAGLSDAEITGAILKLKGVEPPKTPEKKAVKRGGKSTRIGNATSIYPLTTGYWYARVNMKKLIDGFEVGVGGCVCQKISLRTKDKSEAMIEAVRLEEQLKMGVDSEQGRKAVVGTQIGHILILYLKELEKKNEKRYGEYFRFLSDYFYPFVSRAGAIRNFTTALVYKYFMHLKDVGLTNSKTRLQYNQTSIKMFISYCLNNGYIKDGQQPKIPSAKDLGVEKIIQDADFEHPKYLPKDLKNVLENFENFYESTEKKNHITLFNRSMLKFYFNFLNLMGCRPGEEPLGIEFTDLKREPYGDELIFTVNIRKGKMGEDSKRKGKKGRKVELFEEAMQVIREICFFRFSRIMTDDEILGMTGPIFYDLNVAKSVDYAKTWTQYRAYLTKKGLLSQHYDLYSCRHTFINRMIMAGKTKEYIAKHCGNSIETIERYYEEHDEVLRQK